jgi:hypothetical protein
MGHAVRGLIAQPETLEAFACKHSLRPPVALSAGLSIVPLRDSDLDSFLDQPFSTNPEHANLLSDEFIDALHTASRGGALMYFETDYFGGQGIQTAAVFQDGALVFGPESAELGPINAALQLLGIRVKPPAVDEFDTVGLGRHRHTEDWQE